MEPLTHSLFDSMVGPEGPVGVVAILVGIVLMCLADLLGWRWFLRGYLPTYKPGIVLGCLSLVVLALLFVLGILKTALSHLLSIF